MGWLTRFGLAPYRFPYFVETGTGLGQSLAYAQQFPFRHLFSIEIDLDLHQRAKRVFGDDARITLKYGHSADELLLICLRIPAGEGVLFWLDAHYPGSDYKAAPWDAEPDLTRRLPLEAELSAIAATRPDGNFYIIADDLRIYEDGPYEHGNLPADFPTLPPSRRNLAFLAPFEESHNVLRLYADDGYLLIVPKSLPAAHL